MTDISFPDATARRAPYLRRIVAPLIAFFSLFLLFLEATPPASAPDEPSHFVRLGGMVRGQWIGPVPSADRLPPSTLTPLQLTRLRSEAGVFEVSPRYLYVIGGDCNAFRAEAPACAAPREVIAADVTEQISFHGRGLIGGYLAPAAFSALGWSGRSTFYLARLGAASMIALLLTLALVAVGRIDPLATIPVVAGIAVAYTPLAAFLSGVLSPSATGVAGNLALLCTTWALLRSGERDRTGQVLWLVALLAACTAQRVGYVFAAMSLLAGLLSAGATPFALWRRLSWPAIALAAFIGAGAIAWDTLTAVSVPSETSIWSLRTLRQHVESVWTTTKLASTHLGWLDILMPAWITTLWSALYVWCILGAMVLSDRRWSVSIAVLGLVYFCIGIAIAHAYKPTGFGLQARFFLPGLVLLPVASLLHLAAAPQQPWRRLNPHVLYGLCAGAMIVAIFTLLQRHVVGIGATHWFFQQGAFRPLGGWPLLGFTLATYVVSAAATVWMLAPDRSADMAREAGRRRTDARKIDSAGN